MKSTLTIIALIGSIFQISSCKEQAAPVFETISSASSNIRFINNVDTSKAYRILYFFYFYNGAGVATGDINNDGLVDIFFTANQKGGNKLYLNRGNFTFEDITEKAGVKGQSDWCTGVTMADINGDGFLDIYVSSVNNIYDFHGRNELYINNKGDGSFTESAMAYGLGISSYANQASFFDYDHDGDLDCYLLNQSFKPAENLVDTSNRNKPDELSGDRLFRNDVNTTGKFTDVSREAGIYQSALGYGLGIAVADFNNDGWEDIYIGNDFQENDYYYLNNKKGGFIESGANAFGHYSRFSMGNDVADFNNDGQLDIFTADMLPNREEILKTYTSGESPDIYNYIITKNGYQSQYSKNCLQLNNGNGQSFSDVSLIAGVSATDWSWCPLFADFDNDGNKDLFVSTGIVKRTVDLDYLKFLSNIKIEPGTDPRIKYNEALGIIPDGASHNRVFQGNGQLTFTDKSKDWGLSAGLGYHTGAAYADFDNDGDVDLVINAIGKEAVLYKNNAPKKNYIDFELKGTDANTFGIGTKVWLFHKGKIQYQQVMSTRGFQSSSVTKIHFGLDTLTMADSAWVVWPDQQKQVIKNIAVNRTLSLKQADATILFQSITSPGQIKLMDPENYTMKSPGFKHEENNFVDNSNQYLIPHFESTRGPKLSVADVNKDGLEDFYIAGASGQLGSLMIQQKTGDFFASKLSTNNRPLITEEVDAVFFDANNDQYPDLLVLSGGNELQDGQAALEDHLYINNRKGQLIESAGAMPSIRKNKSCVSVVDTDKDGDLDIFIGVLADSKRYGISQTSYLLLNNAKGQFTIASKESINLEGIGMVTSAVFSDIDKDSWPDLMITGEWMSVKVFHNKAGKFIGEDIPGSTGLWQIMYPADINNDGLIDLLIGNWGKNTKLFAAKESPLKLYVKDLDGNGSDEQILCYKIGNSEYSFFSKEELERPLPMLKKTFLQYKEAAGKTVQSMFGEQLKGAKELTAERLASACFINRGKAGFERIDLPDELQLGPIFSFSNVSKENTWIAAGNFYGVTPFEGRYDAQLPGLFRYDSVTKQFKVEHLLNIKGEMRDMKPIKSIDGVKSILMARNNDQVLLFRSNLNYQ